MYKIEWDKNTGGVLLSSKVQKETLGISPRPVFYEELDLIGLNKLGWDYPHSNEPIMWAVNKQYWYKGIMLFEVKGANIYDAPTILLAEGIEPISLSPVDVSKMLERNRDQMFLLESEAVEFIRDVYISYAGVNKVHDKNPSTKNVDFEALAEKVEKKMRTKMVVVKEDCDSFDIMPLETANNSGKKVLLSTRIDKFIASFSGGKDSQVVLDLCTRAMPPSDYEVIYSDTGYELPPSLHLYEETQLHYKKLFPALKFSTARNHESVFNYWDKIGSPSDTHRWCCSVMKTAPLYRALKIDGNKQAKVLAFEGVRAEESSRRNGYSRIGKGVKHSFVVNARPIFDWSTTEIFLYLLKYNLPINQAYRQGKPRVGCVICPFGSPWDDMIVSKCYGDNLKPFLQKIEKMVSVRKIPNAEEYIKERKWKLRASGTNVGDKTHVEIKNTPSVYEVIVKNPQKDFFTWLPALGSFTICKKGNVSSGELLFEKKSYSFEIDTHSSYYTLKVHDGNNIRLRYFIRRVVYKSAYCINCEACEIECPTGALSVYPKINININKCTHCLKCIDFHQNGCIVADSLITTMNNTNQTTKISRYGTFGIQEGWVDEFLSNPDSFWNEHTLGTKQVPSFKAWLKDAEIIDEKGNLTDLGKFCCKNKEDYPSLIWEIIYVNLCYNSALLQWFINQVKTNFIITRKDLEASMLEYFNGAFSVSTIKYALQALLQVFKYTPIGDEFEQLLPQDNKSSLFLRKPYNDISIEGTAYAIYKYASIKGVDMCRISDFYKVNENQGVYKQFGVSKTELEKKLRSISLDPSHVLIAELNMGLDHISLKKGVSILQMLEIITQ